MVYVSPSKFSRYPGQGGQQATASPEGINAFLARVRQAQNDADQAADLRMQEQVASGAVNIDQQIQYNRDRQQRFLPSTKEYQQLANNIADLNVAKKWQVLSTMDANGQPKLGQIQYLTQWANETTIDSELRNQISDRIGKIRVQYNQDVYASGYEAKRTAFSLGQLQRADVISFLEGQLASATEEDLKFQIQQDLDTQITAKAKEVSDFRDTTITGFDRRGDPESEGRYLGLLEDSLAKHQAVGDAAGVAQRQGEIDTQRRYLVGVSLDRQEAAAEAIRLSNPGPASNEKYLSMLRGIQSQRSGDFTYTGTDGSTKTLHIDDLQNIRLNSGVFSGDTLANSLNKRTSDFIQNAYIPDKAADIQSQLTAVDKDSSGDYDKMSRQASLLAADWTKFKSQTFLQPYAGKLSEIDQTITESMAQKLVSALDNKFTLNKVTDQGALQEMEKIQQMFPTARGVDFNKNVIGLQQHIATPNFNRFTADIGAQLDEKINQVQAAMTAIQYQGQGGTPDTASLTKLNMDLKNLQTEKSNFDRQYTTDNFLNKGQNYLNFLPDKQGKIKGYSYKIKTKTSGLENKFAAAPKGTPTAAGPSFYTSNPTVSGAPKTTPTGSRVVSTVGAPIKIPNPSKLAGYSESELDRRPDGIYLKPGVEKRF